LSTFVLVTVVPEVGVEPTRPFEQRILSPPCLPFHHSGPTRIMPGTVWRAGTIDRVAAFFAGVITGVAAVGLLVIVLAPSRRVRAEARLDREVETRLLLGVDPDIAAEAEAAPSEHRSDFGAAELQALRTLGSEHAGSRRRGRNR
jgi:hypothetical protein